jgi:hypothetical protein
MAGTGSHPSFPLFLRAVEGLGLIIIIGIFFAIGTCLERKVPEKAQKITRVSPVHSRRV